MKKILIALVFTLALVFSSCGGGDNTATRPGATTAPNSVTTVTSAATEETFASTPAPTMGTTTKAGGGTCIEKTTAMTTTEYICDTKPASTAATTRPGVELPEVEF